MSIYNSKLWVNDLDETIALLPNLEALEGKSILITGCTGLICSALVDVLIRWNETHVNKINIIAATRSAKKVSERFAPYDKRNYFTFVFYDASSMKSELNINCDYIIHGASNASPNNIIKEPVETMMSNFIGMKHLLDCARVNRAERVLFISTSEVYGKKEDNKPSKENDYGWIDLLNPRNSYSIGKCAAETLCASYYDEYGVDSVIIRPGHIYGPTAYESDNRVSSAWAYAASRGDDIVMKSDGSQIRSYCYCLDCASAIITVLLKGQSVHAYNISNPESVISIRKMAEIVAASANVGLRIELPSDKEKKGFNPMSNSSLDGTELMDLGWKGIFNAQRGFLHTVAILKEIS